MADLDPNSYTVAWIAPLRIEAQAALHMLDNRHDGHFPVGRGDDYLFLAGDIFGLNVVIATLPAGQEYGTGSAAALASQIKKFFPNLWFGILVGVAAGLPRLSGTKPRDIRLGDVLVALCEGENAAVVAYDLGKETGDGLQLLRNGHVLTNTESVVRSAIGNIRINEPNEADLFLPYYEAMKHREHAEGTFINPGHEQDRLYEVDDLGAERLVQRDRRPDARTRVWYGSIGSGEKLTKNASKRNELRDKYNVIGLEMEAAGTMNRIPVGVIRGVCDYGDEYKDDEWQPYAAAMAAAYAKAVLYKIGAIGARQQEVDKVLKTDISRPTLPSVKCFECGKTGHYANEAASMAITPTIFTAINVADMTITPTRFTAMNAALLAIMLRVVPRVLQLNPLDDEVPTTTLLFSKIKRGCGKRTAF